MQWQDGKCRCCWANPRNPAYLRYHDSQWGVPVYDDRMLFEMLTLELFQSGLSWECVLNKREAFLRAFDGFDPRKIASYTGEKTESLLLDPGIIRNRRKIQATICNAQVFLEIQREQDSFSDYLWGWTRGRVIAETGKANSPLSDAIAKDLKARGMRMVGSTTVYAYLQAVGILWGHEEGCFLYGTVPPGKNQAEKGSGRLTE